MKKLFVLLFVLFSATFLLNSCNNDDDNDTTLSEHIRGSITATIHYPNGSIYNFVADTVAIAYLSPTSDSLFIVGTDKNRRSIALYLDNTPITEGATLTPDNVLGEEGFLSFYQDYSSFPYVLQLGANGIFGPDDQLTITALNTGDQTIEGTFELTTYPMDLSGDFDIVQDNAQAIRITNGQFSLNYFNSPQQAQAYQDTITDPDPDPSTVSTLTCNITTSNGVLMRDNYTITVNGTLGHLMPSVPNIFVITKDIGNNYQFSLSFLPTVGTQTIDELSEQAVHYIVENTGTLDGYNFWANAGTISITTFDPVAKRIAGTYSTSGSGFDYSNPDEEVLFESGGSFDVYYP